MDGGGVKSAGTAARPVERGLVVDVVERNSEEKSRRRSRKSRAEAAGAHILAQVNVDPGVGAAAHR